MRALLRYSVCVLVTFTAAAYALGASISAFCSLGIHAYGGGTDGGELLFMRSRFIEVSFLWHMLPVVVNQNEKTATLTKELDREPNL
jgi:hypothetical protein